MDDEYGPVVASYTRAAAFEGGTFVEIPPAVASAAGIEMPLIIAAGARQESWQVTMAARLGGC